MTNNIDSMTNQYLQISGRPTQPQGPDKSMDKSSLAAGAPATQSQNVDTIELTDDVRLMQAVEAKLSTVAEVDTKRVDDVRSRIESGNYEISAERTADKMLSVDQAMPGDK